MMKAKRIRNAVKDLARGSGNRVADGASVLQHGDSASDHAHVKRVTPLETKKRELQNDPQYQPDAINPSRETSTSRKRADKETKPV